MTIPQYVQKLKNTEETDMVIWNFGCLKRQETEYDETFMLSLGPTVTSHSGYILSCCNPRRWLGSHVTVICWIEVRKVLDCLQRMSL
jgi:hypothetical protein